MAFPQPVNFRDNVGYVTDGAGEDWDRGFGNASYPKTSAQGNTYGTEQGSFHWNGADRDNTNDRRLAGICYTTTNGDTWRIDLPASGSYDIRFAAGDAAAAQGVGWDLYDTTTSLGNLTTGSTSGAQKFKDATDTEYTNLTWPGSNTAVNKTFSTTICRLKSVLGGAGISLMAHFRIDAAAGGGGGTFLPQFANQSGKFIGVGIS